MQEMALPAKSRMVLHAVEYEMQEQVQPQSIWEQTWRYQIDRWQRNILFLDTLRERANNAAAHQLRL
jgi:hypothetical protein